MPKQSLQILGFAISATTETRRRVDPGDAKGQHPSIIDPYVLRILLDSGSLDQQQRGGHQRSVSEAVAPFLLLSQAGEVRFGGFAIDLGAD